MGNRDRGDRQPRIDLQRKHRGQQAPDPEAGDCRDAARTYRDDDDERVRPHEEAETVSPNGTRRRGEVNGNVVEVFGDLREGDVVIRQGNDEIRPGAKITAGAGKT